MSLVRRHPVFVVSLRSGRPRLSKFGHLLWLGINSRFLLIIPSQASQGVPGRSPFLRTVERNIWREAYVTYYIGVNSRV